jgi:hypothetical protein
VWWWWWWLEMLRRLRGGGGFQMGTQVWTSRNTDSKDRDFVHNIQFSCLWDCCRCCCWFSFLFIFYFYFWVVVVFGIRGDEVEVGGMVVRC